MRMCLVRLLTRLRREAAKPKGNLTFLSDQTSSFMSPLQPLTAGLSPKKWVASLSIAESVQLKNPGGLNFQFKMAVNSSPSVALLNFAFKDPRRQFKEIDNSRKFKATGRSFTRIHPNAPSVRDAPPQGTPGAAFTPGADLGDCGESRKTPGVEWIFSSH